MVYCATARVGLWLNTISQVATVVWMPSGIALAALLVLGFRVWPGVLVGGLLLSLSFRRPGEGSLAWLASGVPIAIGNTLEPVLGAYLLRRAGFRPSLARVTDVLWLAVLAAVLSTMVSATMGVTSLWAEGLMPAAAVARTWASWWLGNALGALLVAPPLLAWSGEATPATHGSGGRAEAVALGTAVVAVTAATHFAFTDVSPEFTVLKPYLAFPLLIWGALRFGPRGTAVTMLAVAALGIVRTAASLHAAPSAELSRALTLTQVFDGIAAVTVMVLTAAISERRAAEAALRLLSDASRSLSQSLDYTATIERVARLALPLLADWCVVDVIESARPERLAAVHADPAMGPLVDELRTRHPLQWESSQTAARVLRGGKAALLASVTGDTLASEADSPEHAALLRAIGVGSMIIAPLTARDRTLGVITFARGPLRPGYRASEMTLVEELADRAAMAIENARLYEEAQSVIHVRDENETLHTLVRILSHDLANTVQGLIAISVDLGELEAAKARKLGDQLMKAAETQASIIRGARDAYRAGGGPRRLKTQRVDLGEAVELALSLLGPSIRAKELVVVNEVPERAHFAEADPQTLVHQVLSNLLSNAVKFTPRGKRIEVRVEPRGEEVVLLVADQGVGMNPDALTTAGKTRAVESLPGTEGERGTGFGLLQVAHFVDVYGGRVEVTSHRPGEGEAPSGTTFRIVLKKASP